MGVSHREVRQALTWFMCLVLAAWTAILCGVALLVWTLWWAFSVLV